MIAWKTEGGCIGMYGLVLMGVRVGMCLRVIHVYSPCVSVPSTTFPPMVWYSYVDISFSHFQKSLTLDHEVHSTAVNKDNTWSIKQHGWWGNQTETCLWFDGFTQLTQCGSIHVIRTDYDSKDDNHNINMTFNKTLDSAGACMCDGDRMFACVCVCVCDLLELSLDRTGIIYPLRNSALKTVTNQ